MDFDTRLQPVVLDDAVQYSAQGHDRLLTIALEEFMKLSFLIVVLVLAQCGMVSAAEPEFQVTPRLGFGKIRLDPDAVSIDVSDRARTADAGVSVGYLSPFGVILEAGLQYQATVTLFGSDDLSFAEQYLAAGFQFEFGSGFRLTPKVGRARWQLRTQEGKFLNPGPEARERIDGYEDFWEVSFTKTVVGPVAMGLRYRSAEYEFGRVQSTMFVTTFGFR